MVGALIFASLGSPHSHSGHANSNFPVRTSFRVEESIASRLLALTQGSTGCLAGPYDDG